MSAAAKSDGVKTENRQTDRHQTGFKSTVAGNKNHSNLFGKEIVTFYQKCITCETLWVTHTSKHVWPSSSSDHVGALSTTQGSQGWV